MPEFEPIYMEDQTAGAYLTQARDALVRCGDVQKLYGTARVTEDMDRRSRAAMHFAAQSRQLEAARTSILFSALAGEAYINGFLGAELQAADFEAVERLSTSDKFILGPELAVGERLFERGSEPGQTLGELFRLRHDLVHPKMRQVRVDGVTLIDERFEKFNPKSAAEFLVAVADAAYVLAEHQDPAREPDATVVGVRRERGQLTGFGESLREGMPPPQPASRLRPYRRRRDPLYVDSIVPHDAAKFLTAISSIAGTATHRAMPEVPTPRELSD